MSLDCSYDTKLLAEQELEDLLSCLSERLQHIQRSLRLLPPGDECRDRLALLLGHWSRELENLEEHVSSSSKRGPLCSSEEKALPMAVQCANPACSQTFWKWRLTDPQRFCSPACVRQGHLLAGQPLKSTHPRQGRGRGNPGVAKANQRRGAMQREQRAHEYALRLLAEASLDAPEQETCDEGGS